MPNRQRAEARRKAAAKAARQEDSSMMWLWVTLGVVAVAAVIVTVVLVNGDHSDSADDTVASSESKFPDSQPVTVTGDVLPPYEGPYESITDDPAVGLAAPVLAGKNFRGDDVVLGGTGEGPTMVVFLAHWCSHCNAEVPRLLDWKNSGGVPTDLDVVGVATAVSSTAQFYPPAQWFETKGWSWPVMVDEKVDDNKSAGVAAQTWGAPAWPYFVIVGSDGTVLARSSGELTVDEIQQIVDAAMRADAA